MRPRRRLALALLIVPLLGLVPAGCSNQEEEAARDRLADLVVEARAVELEALTRRVDPESLNLWYRIKSLEVSIHDTHADFERQLEHDENINRELEGEIREFKTRIAALKARHRPRFQTLDQAWNRYWAVLAELERARNLAWRTK